MKIFNNNFFIFIIAFVTALAFTRTYLADISDFKSTMYSAIYLFFLIPLGFATIKFIYHLFDMVVLKFNKG